MHCLKTSLWLCTGFANGVKGALQKKAFPALLQIAAWCLALPVWRKGRWCLAASLRGEWLEFLRALAVLWQAPLSLMKMISRVSAHWEESCRGNVSLKHCLLYIPYVFLQIQHMGARRSYLGPSPGSGLWRKVSMCVLFFHSVQEIASLFCCGVPTSVKDETHSNESFSISVTWPWLRQIRQNEAKHKHWAKEQLFSGFNWVQSWSGVMGGDKFL